MAHFCSILFNNSHHVLLQLVVELVSVKAMQWSKVRGCGDPITTGLAKAKRAKQCSYVQVCTFHSIITFLTRSQYMLSLNSELKTFYGRLETVYTVKLQESEVLGIINDKEHLICVIKPCNTHGCDATTNYFTYASEDRGWKIFDLSIVTCVVDRIKLTSEKWGIADQSKPGCWP